MSYGTVAIVLSARIALRRAQPFVRSVYTPLNDLSKFSARLNELTTSPEADFLEGIVLGEKSFIVIQSYFAEDAGDLPLFEPGPQVPPLPSHFAQKRFRVRGLEVGEFLP